MVKIQTCGFIKMLDLLTENNMSSYQMVDVSIGNDDKIYCLFTEKIPERVSGMFVPTTNCSVYKVISFVVDWYSGETYAYDHVDFGVLKINIHFIQPIKENFLLLGARAMLYKDGKKDKNALVMDHFGNKLNSFCLGDGIENCIVDSKNNIITSYFDEGIFGNYGWDTPIGARGIVKWSEFGEKVWENNNHDICDCYAMNIDDNNNLWFYYYIDFSLVKTDFKSEIVYSPKISGSHGFLISKSQTALLFHRGYGKKGFCTMKMSYGKLYKPSDCQIVFGNRKINIERFSFRSSKAVFLDITGDIYFLDWIYG